MNTIDLHIHSTHSDGTCSIPEIIALAEAQGLTALAITDHDTLSHVRETSECAKETSIDVLSGVEVSADCSYGTMHILGFLVNPQASVLGTMLEGFRQGRDERNPRILEKLNKLGLPITYEEVAKEAAGATMGRPHIARVLVAKGLVSSTEEVFQKYLAKGALAYVDRKRFSSREIIAAIHEAGGVAFLAHPKQLQLPTETKLRAVVEALVAEGLDGIEVYSSSHSAKDIRLYKRLTERWGLLISGGSDFHGTGRPGVTLGYAGPGVELSYDIVEAIKQKRKHYV